VKSSTLFLSSWVLVFAAILAAATFAQTPSGQTPEARIYPAPTNLKVLPKDLTGEQLHAIMEQWSAALGAHCNTCHVEDRNNIGPNGRPRLNFADDSKEMKLAARTMFTMTEKINVDYVSKIDSSGAPVTCGTCHRGHLGPEPFVAPSEAGGPPPPSAAPYGEGQHPGAKDANR
jgi:hypothetical protein